MLTLYQGLTRIAKPYMNHLLQTRVKKGKEDETRLDERKGRASLPRPGGSLVWVHAASVGEAQSALILINRLLERYKDARIMVTTGTKTSAELMVDRLPKQAFHQFYPLDHPEWVQRFLDHWRPDAVLWLESELWPNMLLDIQARDIPCVLLNARLSQSSFRSWKRLKRGALVLLSTFDRILTQNEAERHRFEALGAQNVVTAGNIKFSARPLACDDLELQLMKALIGSRPVWLYASSHAGEEAMAARVHERLKNAYPDLLTMIVPRHPERRDEIAKTLSPFGLEIVFRGEDKEKPQKDTDIYVADTLGELGLFYRLTSIALIGRSFSDDGGGGHNPIEAGQLHCAVLSGPNVQNLQQIFDEMEKAQGCLRLKDEQGLIDALQRLFDSESELEALQQNAYSFANSQAQIVDLIMHEVSPLIDETLMIPDPHLTEEVHDDA